MSQHDSPPAATPSSRQVDERWLLALPILLTVYYVVEASKLAVFDPDVWWIAAAGREILRTGRVLYENTFSFTEPHLQWVMHEWLLAAPYALGLEARGPAFFAEIGMGLGLVYSVLMTLGTIGRSRSVIVGAALCAVGIAVMGLPVARPKQVAIVLPVAMFLLTFSPRLGWHRAISIIALEWLWANIHGSFPLGGAIIAASILEHRDQWRSRLGVALAAGLVTFVNPYGVDLHALVAAYVTGGTDATQAVHQQIAEFFPLWRGFRRAATPMEVLWLLVATILGVRALLRRRNLVRALFLLVLAAGAIAQTRHITIAGTLSVLLLVPELDSMGKIGALRSIQAATACADTSTPGMLRRASSVAACMVALSLLLAAPIHLRALRMRTQDDWVGPPDHTIHVESLVAAVPDNGRLFATFQVAGQAIWYGFPRNVRVFYDPRNDCFSAALLHDAGRLDSAVLRPDMARRIFDAYDVGYVIARANSRLADNISRDARWREFESKGGWSLYTR